MKKLFVSVPVKGRTEGEIRESIQKMKKFAELLEGEELDLIDSYVEDTPPQTNTQAIWYLGKSLEKLAEADIFIGICDSWDWNGCHIEDDTATRYGIKKYVIPPEYVIANYHALLRSVNHHPVANEVCSELPR